MKKIKKLVIAVLMLALTVTIIPVSSTQAAVRLNATKKTLNVGQTTTLKVKGTSKKVKWSSSNKGIASVTQKGKVTAKNAGTATITAKVSGKSLKCRITVNQNFYKIGQTWTVPGQWSITINSVQETSYRNEYADTNPEAVYMIDYTYENLGYVDQNGIMNGLFLDFELSQIVDAVGYTGYAYPGDITYYSQEIPIGAKCHAQSCIGVDHRGNFKLYYDTYDGNGIDRKAAFEINLY